MPRGSQDANLEVTDSLEGLPRPQPRAYSQDHPSLSLGKALRWGGFPKLRRCVSLDVCEGSLGVCFTAAKTG